MNFYTYILKSVYFNRFYYGHTHNLYERLKIHNYGKVRSTKAFRPWIIHYYESFSSRSEAYQRELFFKSAEGKLWLKQNSIIP
uniref:GIY-YIG nuclease family protein n=1 Tax=Ignavibacterium album TaxID=591197 RepID=A0A832DFZ2_9BACT